MRERERESDWGDRGVGRKYKGKVLKKRRRRAGKWNNHINCLYKFKKKEKFLKRKLSVKFLGGHFFFFLPQIKKWRFDLIAKRKKREGKKGEGKGEKIGREGGRLGEKRVCP